MLPTPQIAVFKVSRGAINMKMVLFSVLFCLSASAVAGEIEIRAVDTKPDASLKAKFDDYFQRADTLNVAYVPNSNLGSRLLEKTDVFKAWRYNFSYRCAYSCESSGAPIRRFFSNALRLENECPKPFTTAFTFKKTDTAIQSVFINNTGRCFTLDGESYFAVDGNFNDFVKKGELFPSLTVTETDRD